MIKKILAGLGGLALVLGAILLPAAGTASAATCNGNFTLGVGGFGDPNATTWKNVDQRITYSAQLSAQSAQQGIANLHTAAAAHRASCPGDHIQVFGFSEGAAVAHSWLSQKQMPNTSAVLIGDPKRPAGPGGPGFASLGWIIGLGAPLNGVDGNYGTVPVLQVCNHDDGICDVNAGPWGYLFGGAHLRYDFDATHYAPGLRGTRYL